MDILCLKTIIISLNILKQTILNLLQIFGICRISIFLKNKKYLFVDGRYTIQAQKESGNKFEICEIPYVWPKMF